MNILVINWRCPKNPEMGGAEVHMHEIFKRIAARGHEVTLVAHKYKGAPKKEKFEGINIIRVGDKFLFNKEFKRYYKKNLSRQPFDLVVDDISKIPLFTPKYINKPLVGIIHHIHGESLYTEIPRLPAMYIIRTEKLIPFVYRNTPIFAVSESTKNELAELGQPEDKIEILYNAIDQELFNNIKVEKSAEPTITYIGRIKKYKNLEAIVDALPAVKDKFPEIKLRIGGSGDHLPKLKAYVKQKGLNNDVEFLGYLSEEDKAKEMGKAWLFVTMALKEGWGITVIEANAMGTPVVGSDVPGLQDSIKDGITGKLVDLNNPQNLADTLLDILGNKDKLEQMSQNAKDWSSKFTWDASADFFLEKVYEWYPSLRNK